MKKTLLKDITVFILILLIIFIICLFLPDNIAVHFNLYGSQILSLTNISFYLFLLYPIQFIGNISGRKNDRFS